MPWRPGRWLHRGTTPLWIPTNVSKTRRMAETLATPNRSTSVGETTLVGGNFDLSEQSVSPLRFLGQKRQALNSKFRELRRLFARGASKAAALATGRELPSKKSLFATAQTAGGIQLELQWHRRVPN
jgi:hypothetical protein